MDCQALWILIASNEEKMKKSVVVEEVEGWECQKLEDSMRKTV